MDDLRLFVGRSVADLSSLVHDLRMDERSLKLKDGAFRCDLRYEDYDSARTLWRVWKFHRVSVPVRTAVLTVCPVEFMDINDPSGTGAGNIRTVEWSSLDHQMTLTMDTAMRVRLTSDAEPEWSLRVPAESIGEVRRFGE